MAHVQKPDFVVRRNGRVHLNRWGRQFSRLLATELCASAVVMLGTSCSEVVWRLMATHSIRQFPLHFPSRASPCAIRFRTSSTFYRSLNTAADRTPTQDPTSWCVIDPVMSFENQRNPSVVTTYWNRLASTTTSSHWFRSGTRNYTPPSAVVRQWNLEYYIL